MARLRQLASAGEYDAVILQRKLLPRWELSILRRHARELAFDFDDAVLFRDSYDRRGPYSARKEARFAAVVKSADVVIAGNDFLADCALRAGASADRVRTIPTCIDPDRYPIAVASSKERGPGQVDLVWIGSSSTLKGLERQHALLDRLGQEVPGLRLRVICDRFPRFDHLPVLPIPWAEAWEGRDLAAGQIGISWVPDDPWSRGKCGLKVLQYQAARLPVVANPVGVQNEFIEPGQTGFLPRNDDEWLEAIRFLAENPECGRTMGLLARHRLETDFSVAAWADTFVSSVTAAEPNERRAISSHTGPARQSVPEPFFARLRRMGKLSRVAPISRLDGTRVSN